MTLAVWIIAIRWAVGIGCDLTVIQWVAVWFVATDTVSEQLGVAVIRWAVGRCLRDSAVIRWAAGGRLGPIVSYSLWYRYTLRCYWFLMENTWGTIWNKTDELWKHYCAETYSYILFRVRNIGINIVSDSIYHGKRIIVCTFSKSLCRHKCLSFLSTYCYPFDHISVTFF